MSVRTIDDVLADYKVAEERKNKLAGLRWLVDMLGEHPELPMPYSFQSAQWYPSDATEASKIIKVLGGSWEKNDPSTSAFDEQYMTIRRKAYEELSLDVTISRGQVCERKVVGTRRVTKNVTVTATEMKEVDEDIVEFDCGSLLSAAAQEQMESLGAMTE